jgi:predicted amidohydrolase YtcJ
MRMIIGRPLTPLNRLGTLRAVRRHETAAAVTTTRAGMCGMSVQTARPVAPYDPMRRISGIVNRPARPGGTDQRLPLPTAIEAYTRGPAYASFEEQRLGTLAPGMLADIVVLETDIFTHPPTKSEDVALMMTVVDGKVVYQAKGRPDGT